MKDKLFQALKDGKICVIDISQMRGQAGLILSGIILHIGDVKIESEEVTVEGEIEIQETGDYLRMALLSVIESAKKDNAFINEVSSKGKPWKGVIVYFQQKLPNTIDNNERESIAADNMKFLLDSVFGEGKW